MCGIAGYILKTATDDPGVYGRGLLEGMRRRGPDDEGAVLIDRASEKVIPCACQQSVVALRSRLPQVFDAGKGVAHDAALFQTRHAIIDLSAGGHQPFISHNGRITAVFNGEIYNYLELRAELVARGISFQTGSDTEVLVEGYVLWGDALWDKMTGFWAVVLYDRLHDRFVLSRDRLGVAPLYYRETSKGIFFASGLDPLVRLAEHPVASPDQGSVWGFMAFGIKDHEDTTCYEGIKSFPAASFGHLDQSDHQISRQNVWRFWHLPVRRLTVDELSFDAAVKEYRRLLWDAVALRLRADVKIAFELSGGLDSSSVVAAAADISGKGLTTYTARVAGADEEPYARSLRERYGLDYKVLDLDEQGLARAALDFTHVMEEPYDNPNNYTHHLMLRRMRDDGAKVVLTGAGGDEVFAGYEASYWPPLYREWCRQGGRAFGRADLYEFCRRFRTWSSVLGMGRHYASFLGGGRRKAVPVHALPVPTRAAEHVARYAGLSFQERSRYHIEVALLPYYMRSSDHFTMSIPIEHRFPLLDHRLVTFGLTLPPEYLFHHGWTKYLVRRAMEPYLPSGVIWRRQKMGFAFPYGTYLKEHAASFRHILRSLGALGADQGLWGGYDVLLEENPVLLWRVLSTALWLSARERG